MENVPFETVTHTQEGESITYVFRDGRRDWFVDHLRNRAHTNPAWFLLHRRRLTENRMMKYADFGANLGATSLLPAKIGHQVLAVEAGPENVLCLGAAARASGVQDTFTLAHWAASGAQGLMTFYEASAWGSSKVVEQHQDEALASTVPAATVADILDTYGMADVDVIKMDIEGSELAALTGFERIAEANAEVELVIESNWESSHEHGYEPQAIWQRLVDMGFDIYLLEGRKLMPVTPLMPQLKLVSEILATRRPRVAIEKPLGFIIEEMDMADAEVSIAAAGHPDRAAEINAAFITDQLAKLAQ